MTSKNPGGGLSRREFVGRVAGGAAVLGAARLAGAEEGGAAMRPNILFLLVDQMQGRVLDPGHVCKTPNLDRLAARGVRFSRACATNAVCSPARAGIMTGLLPHNHGVLQVTHCTFDDESVLRDSRHWGQCLQDAGYNTGYFGKWHVERSYEMKEYGWNVNGEEHMPMFRKHRERMQARRTEKVEPASLVDVTGPEGYETRMLCGVTDEPVEERMLGVTCALASDFLDEALEGDAPWCCVASVIEPHDPFVAHRSYLEQYDVDDIPAPPNWNDDLANKPGLYRKAARAFGRLTEKDKRTAAACYYASITEIDAEFGKLIDKVERAGKLDNTIVVFTSDHGEFLGAHGMYTKNVGAWEEAYHIPLIMAGPGVAGGVVSKARVGSHDLCPTLVEMTDTGVIDVPDSRSLAHLLEDPERLQGEFHTAYAEYFGTRYYLSQRILWDGDWKLVWNGFDFDELYNLKDDPYEMKNLAGDPAYQDEMRRLMRMGWAKVHETGDAPLAGSEYFSLRLAPFGPGV